MHQQLPSKLLESLEGLPGFDRESFEAVHARKDAITSIRINPLKANNFKEANIPFPFVPEDKVLWSRFGDYLPQRPSFTFDPLFHAGLYYVQEASSMFLEQALIQQANLSQPLRVLDLCGAPGGKSTHIQSLLHPESLLVSNEVIKSRSHILTDNILKWGGGNVIVTNNDPQAFQKLEGFFDVVVVDAPCSGSGLFRRDEEAMDEWSPAAVQLCSQRQKRILADALPSLEEDGLLIYSTCSYSREEDEDIADWLVEEMNMEAVQLDIDSSWNIIQTESAKQNAPGYRFYPDKLKGEGFFLSCFRKKASTKTARLRPARQEKLSPKETATVQSWIRNNEWSFLRKGDQIFALFANHLDDYALLHSTLNIQYAGVGLGQIMKEKLVPAHSLALSGFAASEIPSTEVNLETAIRYLQRAEADISASGKGWQLVKYAGFPLGWINVLPNRINNYYPKELRILKQ